MRVLALCAVLAGCGDGIFIEVQAPPGVTLETAELIIADRPCTVDGGGDCTRIQPARFDTDLDPELLFRVDGVDTVAAFDGGTAEFQIAPTDAVVQILVLGTAADGTQAIAVMQPIDLSTSPRRYVVPLVAAKPMDPQTAPDVQGARVVVWGNQRRCFGMQDPRNGRGPVFVVPEADPDCDDDVIARECDNFDHAAAGTFDPATTPINCAAPALVPQTTQTGCFLGQQACDETNPDPCHPLPKPICLSDLVCSQCGNDDGFLACAIELLGLQRAELPTFLSCTVEVQTDGNGDFVPCETAGALPVLGIEPLVAAERSCMVGGLATLEPPIGMFQGATFDLGNGHTFTTNLAAVQASRCEFSIELDGLIDADSVLNRKPFHAAAAIELQPLAGGPTLRTAVFPIELAFVDGCTAEPTQCTPKPAAQDDNLTSCLQ